MFYLKLRRILNLGIDFCFKKNQIKTPVNSKNYNKEVMMVEKAKATKKRNAPNSWVVMNKKITDEDKK